MIRAAAILALATALLVVLSVVGSFASLYPFTPNVILPLVIYLGVAADVELVLGTFLSFLLGYLFDVFGGGPMGVHTLVSTAMFLLVRGAGFSFASRGALFQFMLTLLIALIAGATVFALRAIFETSPPSDKRVVALQTILIPAIATAAFAPFVLGLVARVEMLTSRRRREGVLR